MELLPDARYNFTFAAPDELPPWNLFLDAVIEQVLAVDPEADIHQEDDRGWFDASFPFGGADSVMRSTSIGLRMANTRMAAVFAVWLRTRVLPAGTGIAFMTHEAIELGERPCVLPDSDDPEVIEAAMLPYLQVVEEAYNT